MHQHTHETSPPFLELSLQKSTVLDLALLVTDLKMHLDYERELREKAEDVIANQGEAIAVLKRALAAEEEKGAIDGD